MLWISSTRCIVARCGVRCGSRAVYGQLVSVRRWYHETKVGSKMSESSAAAMLLQKSLIQKNNSFINYGSATIRCTVFDYKGDIASSSVEMKREDLVAKHGLLPRDLRKIEKSRTNDLVPNILVRREGILVSLLPIRALIKRDTVILFDSVGTGYSLDSQSYKDFVKSLQMRLKNHWSSNEVQEDYLPYEFRALEAIFVAALSNLTSETKVLLTICKGILKDLEFSITRDKLRFLLAQNKKLSTLHKKAILVREMLDDILEQDDVLCSMYLSDKHVGNNRSDDDHTEVEMLLETYYSHMDEIVQMIEADISNVKTTEEIINIILDSNRNQLMMLGIKFSIGMLSLGAAIFVGSLYGMNLENFIEETDYGYTVVTTLGVISMVVLFRYYIKHLARLQKMSLTKGHRAKMR